MKIASMSMSVWEGAAPEVTAIADTMTETDVTGTTRRAATMTAVVTIDATLGAMTTGIDTDDVIVARRAGVAILARVRAHMQQHVDSVRPNANRTARPRRVRLGRR